ncbi:probable G-protein coupled receptor Mth-like 12 [Octopus sinensis]|uniref:Probable G-protein coupled receptor Mth-like 12 n=1 Tax=Octopus sinensis TaxID=2607531 RepID=A0A7E6F5R5_9MOLL|nr:probable G-protein coupled receptor Mth-like 12 [Octopus sinensis]
MSTDYSCREINDNKSDSYFLFDRCPNDHSVTEHVTFCETPDENDRLYNIPALGKKTKRLYRNLFCALCNGEEYLLWTVHYKCKHRMNIDLSLFSQMLRNNHCNVSIEAPFNFKDYQYPCTDYVSSCPIKLTNATLVSSCMFEPMSMVTSNGTNFRNIHCAICNSVDINDTECNITVSREMTYEIEVYTFETIFNYNNNTVEVLYASTEKNYIKKLSPCSHGFVYDELKNECRQVEFNFVLNCTTKRLEESEYHITSDGFLYLNSSQTWLNQSEFSRDPQGISICVNDHETRGQIGVLFSLMYIGLLSSVVAIFITITVYLCIPELRTLPGKLIMGLLFSMFVIEFFFLIVRFTKIRIPCFVLHPLLHYLILTPVLWMNVISFDALYTFSGIIKFPVAGKQGKRFIFYSLYAWITPLAIVIVALLFSLNISPKLTHGHFLCYFGNVSFKWFFAFPITTILSINTLMFFITVICLYLARKSSSKYLGLRKKTGFMIYFKLSLIMGFTWVFIPIFAYAYMHDAITICVTLNSYVGLIICITFLSTKTVRRHFKQECCKLFHETK